MILVTGCDAKYIPGAIALRNSVLRNYPEADIYCMVFGDNDAVQRVYDVYGTNTIDNVDFPEGTRFPVGVGWWKSQSLTYYSMPAMYSRLLVPHLFPDVERTMWIDADCLVIQPLTELETMDFQGKPFATGTLDFQRNFERPTPANIQGCHSATILFNTKVWQEKKVTERCIEYMNACDETNMRFVVQSVLNDVVRGDFLPYGSEFIFNAKRGGVTDKTKILHFPVVLPWDKENMARKPAGMQETVRALWEPYR